MAWDLGNGTTYGQNRSYLVFIYYEVAILRLIG